MSPPGKGDIEPDLCQNTGTSSEHSSWAFAGLCKGQGILEIVIEDQLGAPAFLHAPLKVDNKKKIVDNRLGNGGGRL